MTGNVPPNGAYLASVMWVLMRSLETENTCLVTGKAELFGRYRNLAQPSARVV